GGSTMAGNSHARRSRLVARPISPRSNSASKKRCHTPPRSMRNGSATNATSGPTSSRVSTGSPVSANGLAPLSMAIDHGSSGSSRLGEEAILLQRIDRAQIALDDFPIIVHENRETGDGAGIVPRDVVRRGEARDGLRRGSAQRATAR